MAPPKNRSSKASPKPSWTWSNVYASAKSMCVDPTSSNLSLAAALLLVAEAAFNLLVVSRVPYTEIDWRAYMQEVEPFVRNGTADYSVMRGDTGPLVYPAGFVWIFSALFMATDDGDDIRLAQYIYVGLYLLNLALVFRLMIRSEKVPPYALVFMSLLTKRIHSIFVLRLFNDPVAMVFLYAAANCFADSRWTLGSVLYSLAVSVKMNILLFAPALFLAYLACLGAVGTFLQLSVCASVQLLLGAPFLLENPLAYLKGSFDLGRVFLFEWTVNWRFLPEEVFVGRPFHAALMAAHLIVLAACAPKWWKMLRSYAKLKEADAGPSYSSQLLLLPLFMCNFVGVCFARSLHYQFYVWYFHHLHYLLWCTKLPVTAKLAVLGLVELCWNVYPSTVWSSALLHFCHAVVLVGLVMGLYGIDVTVKRIGQRVVDKKRS